MIEKNLQRLGSTDLMISPIGIGILQWGDRHLSEDSDNQADSITQNIYQITLDSGINLFDTAEMYGRGVSETLLGKCLTNKPDNIVIATKFMPFPWRISKGELKRALKNSLKRLGLAYVDLYQMHWPFPPVSIKTWMEAMADAFSDGLIRAIGVSNYSPHQTEIAIDALSKHNIPLASNQVKYSLLDRRPEKSGLYDLCKKMGVTIIAYSPLEKGMLTGKYSPERIPPDYRSWRYNKSFLKKINPLIANLIEIGKAHQGKTPAQVALNWLFAKGAVPIPGARTGEQARENAGSLGWKLTNEEVTKLESVSDTFS